jgi:hypothetical protein
MKLSQIFEAINSTNVSLGTLDGIRIILATETGKPPKKLSLGSLRLASYDVVKKLTAVKKYNVELQLFAVNIRKYKIGLICSFLSSRNILFINEIIPSSNIGSYNSYSVLTLHDLYEVFDDSKPFMHRGFTVTETPHSFDRIGERNLKNIITREQVEQILQNAINTIESLELLDFSVRHALVHSKSARQSIIIDVDHDTRSIDIATYFPNTDDYVAPNCVSIVVE